MAGAFGAKGARILSVSPGSFDTAMGRLEEKSGSGDLVDHAAPQRYGRPEEIAGGTGTHPNIAGITEFYVPVLTAKPAELAGGTSSDPVSGATYKLRNAATGEYLDSGSAGSLSMEPASVYDGQDWILTRGSDGTWTIDNVRSGRSYLDSEPNNVVIWNEGYIGPDTKWSIELAPGGFRLNNVAPDRSYLYVTSTGAVQWNTGATDDSTVWVLERR